MVDATNQSAAHWEKTENKNNMQYNIKSLIGYSMASTDGDIGKVEEFYFEDTTLLIRYLIVKAGNWFLDRKVLIAPQAIINIDTEHHRFPVNLTKEQIRSSPDIDTDKPVSRQQIMELYGHYTWPGYGGSGFYAGGSEAVMDNVPIIDEKIMKEADSNDNRNDDDIHLRSTSAVLEYHIHASDGDIGHVSDFILDDSNWKIMFLIVDTHNWFGGKKVLVEMGKVKEIQWENSKVILDMSVNSLKDCPAFVESEFNHSPGASTSLISSE